MQLQFEKQEIGCLQTLKRELQTQEQTQEVRISDGMPDIGSIIDAWGQVILRGKEWMGDGMRVSGGTMVWIRYLPEDGGVPCCVETWLPFQMSWSFPQTQHDGTILAQPILCGVEARSLSARKLMVRTNVSVLGWAMQKKLMELYQPPEIPSDIQLRRQCYLVELPLEAGEKAFALEETLTLPPSIPAVEQVVGFSVDPQITEEKMMADKVVFRGNAVLRMTCLGEDGGLYSADFDLPFTQYSELDAEYGEDTAVMLWPVVTALETELDGDKLHGKVSLVCQYRICRRTPIEVVTDAYSARRTVEPAFRDLELPGMLESRTQSVHAQQTCSVDAMRLADTRLLLDPVTAERTEDGVTLGLSGHFQMLYYDMEGQLRGGSQKWEEKLCISTGEDAQVEATLWALGKTQGSMLSGSGSLSGELKLMTQTRSGGTVPVMTGLELGELQQPDPGRPSLILRRAEGEDLWTMAKRHGSTVDSIRDANRLEGEPDRDSMLLIPVM